MNQRMTIGVDLAKNSFAVVILDSAGHERQRKTLKRQQVLPYLAKQEASVVAMEACAGSHYWARQIKALGHDVVLLPPQHVKGYLRGQKNDYNDALAIAEACLHHRVRPVVIKTVEQQDEHSFHRIRRSLSGEKLRLSNQLRGLLGEYGLVIARGDAALRRALPAYLSDADNGLTPRIRCYLSRQYDRFMAILDELAWYDTTLREQVRQDEACQRLQEAPGFGPVISSAVKHWMGDGSQFGCGRDASAALGVVPRQHSTGGRERLGCITKRGDAQVRALVVHGARAIVRRAEGKSDPLSQWLQQVKARRGFNKTVIALANKMIRIAWVILARGERYRYPVRQESGAI